MGGMASEEVRWLCETEQVSWRAYLRANRELDVALDRSTAALSGGRGALETIGESATSGRR